jgi:hypothetical protein
MFINVGTAIFLASANQPISIFRNIYTAILLAMSNCCPHAYGHRNRFSHSQSMIVDIVILLTTANYCVPDYGQDNSFSYGKLLCS